MRLVSVGLVMLSLAPNSSLAGAAAFIDSRPSTTLPLQKIAESGAAYNLASFRRSRSYPDASRIELFSPREKDLRDRIERIAELERRADSLVRQAENFEKKSQALQPGKKNSDTKQPKGLEVAGEQRGIRNLHREAMLLREEAKRLRYETAEFSLFLSDTEFSHAISEVPPNIVFSGRPFPQSEPSSNTKPKPSSPQLITERGIQKSLRNLRILDSGVLSASDRSLSQEQAFAAIARQVDSAVRGSAAVRAPNLASEGKPFPVYLRVSAAPLAPLIESFGPKGTSETITGKGNVRLSSRMEASVSGENFRVLENSAFIQAVGKAESTDWFWQVTPLRDGAHTLTVTLSSIHLINGKETPKQIHFQQEITVLVRDKSLIEFLVEYWQFLVATLLVPAIGALWALFRRPKDAAGTVQSSVLERIRERRRERRLRA